MEFESAILREIENSLISQQRLLVTLKQKRDENPDAVELLDPLVAKLEDWTVYLSGVRDELKLSAVARRA